MLIIHDRVTKVEIIPVSVKAVRKTLKFFLTEIIAQLSSDVIATPDLECIDVYGMLCTS